MFKGKTKFERYKVLWWLYPCTSSLLNVNSYNCAQYDDSCRPLQNVEYE